MEQRRQAMLQLHLSYQQFHCLLRCDLYERFYGTTTAAAAAATATATATTNDDDDDDDVLPGSVYMHLWWFLNIKWKMNCI